MTDPATTTPEAPAAAPAEPQVQAPEATPAATEPATPDVESIVSARLSEAQKGWEESLDKRVADFQRMVAERDETIKALKTASMSEDEREQLLVEEEQQRYEAIEVENWLLRKAQENPKAVELFERILNAEPDEQFRVLAELVDNAAATPAPAPQPTPESQVPDIDLHNPSGQNPVAPAGTPTLEDGTQLTPEFRKNFLQGLGGWVTRG